MRKATAGFQTFLRLLCAVCCVLSASVVRAEVPSLIRYQGQATDTNGVPLEGPYILTFRLYDAETAGNEVWEEQQANVPLAGGHFSVLLGAVTSLATIDWNQPVWLSVQVNGEPELSPRQRITSVPLAVRAKMAEQLTQPITPALIISQGSGGGLDADKVDGKDASDFVKNSDPTGGDLSGTYPNPTVTKVQGRDVQNIAPSADQVLRWSAANNRWEPSSQIDFGKFEFLDDLVRHDTLSSWMQPDASFIMLETTHPTGGIDSGTLTQSRRAYLKNFKVDVSKNPVLIVRCQMKGEGNHRAQFGIISSIENTVEPYHPDTYRDKIVVRADNSANYQLHTRGNSTNQSVDLGVAQNTEITFRVEITGTSSVKVYNHTTGALLGQVTSNIPNLNDRFTFSVLQEGGSSGNARFLCDVIYIKQTR